MRLRLVGEQLLLLQPLEPDWQLTWQLELHLKLDSTLGGQQLPRLREDLEEAACFLILRFGLELLSGYPEGCPEDFHSSTMTLLWETWYRYVLTVLLALGAYYSGSWSFSVVL